MNTAAMDHIPIPRELGRTQGGVEIPLVGMQ